MESSLIGLGGALIGIVLGHFLTRSAQHRQWIRDNRKQEFKEVVAAITKMSIEHMAYVASQGSSLPQSTQAYIDSMKEAYQTLTDRIYIHTDLDEKNIPHRFLAIMEEFRDSGKDFDKPAVQAAELLQRSSCSLERVESVVRS